MALRDALRPIAQRHRATVSGVAVAWTLAWPGVTGAIVGGRSPQQVDGWIGAASLLLTAAELQEISDAIVLTGAGEGPTMRRGAQARRGFDTLSIGPAVERRRDDRVRQPPSFFLKLSFSAWTNSQTDR